MKIRPIIFLIIISLLLVGCAEEYTEEQLQAKISEANSNIDTYSFDADMDIAMSMDMFGQQSETFMSVVSEGTIDNSNKKLLMDSFMSMDMGGVDTESEIKMYVVDDYQYTLTMGVWSKQELEEGLWKQTNQLEKTIDLLESGTIEMQEDDSFGGERFYVFKIHPDLKKLFETAMVQEDSPLEYDGINLENMMQDYSVIVWVNKRTFIIEKSVIEMDIAMDSENLGSELTSDSSIQMTMNLETRIEDINKPVTIELPEEAKEAYTVMDDVDDYSYTGSSSPNSVPRDVIVESFN